jgi:hypothetical protein
MIIMLAILKGYDLFWLWQLLIAEIFLLFAKVLFQVIFRVCPV